MLVDELGGKSGNGVPHEIVLDSVHIPRLSLIDSMMIGFNDFQHTGLLKQPFREVFQECRVPCRLSARSNTSVSALV